MEYKMRFHTHIIYVVGYSMHKIQAATLFFAIVAWLLHFAAQQPIITLILTIMVHDHMVLL